MESILRTIRNAYAGIEIDLTRLMPKEKASLSGTARPEEVCELKRPHEISDNGQG